MSRYRIEKAGALSAVAERHVAMEIHPERTVVFQHEVDFTQIESLRRRLRDPAGRKPTYTAFVAKAVGLALARCPWACRRLYRGWLPFAGPRLQIFECRDVAVAHEIDLPGSEMGAVVHILRDVDSQCITSISSRLREIASCDFREHPDWQPLWWMIQHLPARWTAWTIHLQNLLPGWWSRYRGAAALVSSPAKYGVDLVHTSWPWPVGVSFGLVKPRPLAVEGKVELRSSCYLTLAFDRRVMAGAHGARFFHELVQILSEAERTLGPAGAEPGPPLDTPPERRVGERVGVPVQVAEVSAAAAAHTAAPREP